MFENEAHVSTVSAPCFDVFLETLLMIFDFLITYWTLRDNEYKYCQLVQL